MGQPTPEQLSSLLEALFGGLLHAEPWSEFLRRLADQAGATYATLLLTGPGFDAPGTIVTPDANPRTAEDYAEGMFAADPFVGLPEGKVVTFAEFVENVDPAFQHFLETSGSGQILGVDLRTSAGSEARLRLTRHHDLAPFEPGERELVAGLVPHIRIALALFAQMESSAAEQGVYQSAFGGLAFASLMLDRTGRVVRSNDAAQRLLASQSGLAIRGEKLAMADRQASAIIQSMLANLDGSDGPVRFRIDPHGEAPELSAVATPLSRRSFMSEGEPVLALFIADPAQPAEVNPEALRDIFQLTPTEAQITAELAAGASLVEVARLLDMAHNTARSHLRSIFAKTGARRQSQLVHLVRSSAAGVASHHRGGA